MANLVSFSKIKASDTYKQASPGLEIHLHSKSDRSLLRILFLIRLGLRPLLPDSLVSGFIPHTSQLLIYSSLDRLAHLTYLHLAVYVGLGEGVDNWQGHRRSLHNVALARLERLELLRRCIGFVVNTRTTGEEDETCAVGFQTGDVEGERFDGEVLAPRVDRDADCAGEFALNTGFLGVC